MTISLGKAEPISGTPALSIMEGPAGATFHEWRLKTGTAKWTANRSPAIRGYGPPSGVPVLPKVETATKDAPFINTLGMQFVPVSEARVSFCILETQTQDYAAYTAANPGINDHWKNVSKHGVPVSDGDSYPVCSVSWTEANAICAWLSKKEGRTYRLPMDREWRVAVGIGNAELPARNLTPRLACRQVARQVSLGT